MATTLTKKPIMKYPCARICDLGVYIRPMTDGPGVTAAASFGLLKSGQEKLIGRALMRIRQIVDGQPARRRVAAVQLTTGHTNHVRV